MARQGRKNKNELDIILEQLKKSYASDASDSLEDDLLENPTSEEDTELNEILGRIFTYEDPISAVETDIPADDAAEEISDVSCAHDSTVDAAEELSVNDEDSINPEMAVEDINEEAVNDSVELSEDMIEEAGSFETDDIIGGAEESISDIEAVDNVLKEMFSKNNAAADTEEFQNAIESIIDDTTDNNDDDCLDGIDNGIAVEEESDAESYTDVGYEEIQAVNEAFEDKIDDIEAIEDIEYLEELEEQEWIVPETEGEDSAFAVEDEEYAVGDEEIPDEDLADEEKSEEERAFVPYPIPHIILSASQYTDDPLQDNLPIIDTIPALAFLRDQARDKMSDKEMSPKPETQPREESFDENDISLLLKFGYHDEIKSKVGEKKTKEVLLEADNSFVPDPTKKVFGYCGKELNSRRQISEIREKYKTDQRNIIILLSVAATLALCLMYINLSFEFFSDKVSAFPIMLLFDFMLVITLCGVLYKKIASGFNKLMKLGTSANTLFFIVAAAYGIYSVASLIAYAAIGYNSNPDDLMLFGFCVSLYAILCLAADLFNCIRERKAFEIIASSDVFYTAERVVSKHGKKDGEDENIAYRIRKTGLVSGYFRKTSFNEDIGIKPLYLLGIVPIITLVSGVTVFFLSRSFALSASIAMIILLLCIPAPYLFTSSLIRFIISRLTVSRDTAFIGNPAPDQMRKTSELVFDDSEAIDIIGCTEIHPGGRADTQESLQIARDIFFALGGTLKNIDAAAASLDASPREVVINQISETGIDIYYDSSINVLIGDKQYMLRHNIKVKTDTNLHAATRGDDRSVIFMAFDGVPKLGFIISSRIKPDFLKMSERLMRSDVRVCVKTYEPHINEIYFEQNKGNSISSVNVRKPDEYEDPRPIDICDGCIVSSSDAVSLADAIIQSGQISKRCKLNRMINVAIIAINIILCFAMILFVLGDFSDLSLLSGLRSHVEITFLGLIISSFIPAIIEIIDIIKKK